MQDAQRWHTGAMLTGYHFFPFFLFFFSHFFFLEFDRPTTDGPPYENDQYETICDAADRHLQVFLSEIQEMQFLFNFNFFPNLVSCLLGMENILQRNK